MAHADLLSPGSATQTDPQPFVIAGREFRSRLMVGTGKYDTNARMLQAIEMGNQFSYQQMTKNGHAWTPEFRRALQKKLRDAGKLGAAPRLGGDVDPHLLEIGAGEVGRLDRGASRPERIERPQRVGVVADEAVGQRLVLAERRGGVGPVDVIGDLGAVGDQLAQPLRRLARHRP